MEFYAASFVWFMGAFLIWKPDSILNLMIKMGNLCFAMWAAYNIFLVLSSK